MRRIVIIIFVTVLFSSCREVNKQLKERLTVADSAAINYFKGDGTMDTVILVKIIKDKNTLDQLSNIITEEITKEKISCCFDGSLHFFKTGMVIQDIYFRMNNDDDCSQFTYSFKSERGAAKLSADAKKLLLRLKQ